MRKTLGIIPDGHRKYAKLSGISNAQSYTMGVHNLVEFVNVAYESGFTDVVVYAFSLKNIGRTQEELDAIFSYFKNVEVLINKLKQSILPGCGIHFIGGYADLPKFVDDAMGKINEEFGYTGEKNIWICFSYDGRTDIVKAANRLAKEGKEITEESLSNSLSTKDFPDPDAIVRTSSNSRLSGFLLWEASYAELIVTDKYFPQLDKKDMKELLEKVKAREVNHGL